MTLQQLHQVITIAESRSMNEASRKLFVSQPNLSAVVRELEEEAGITIFIRSNRGIVLTRERLLDAIWDVAGEYVNDNTLTVYIKRLREKIEDDPTDPKIILTVRGTGYKVDA